MDFELSAGLCMGSIGGEVLTWTQKALRLSYYLKTIVRKHTIKWNALRASFNQALRSTTDATSIAQPGSFLMSGFARKPRWVDARTPKIAAINVWKARQHRKEQTLDTTIAERRSRTFART